MCGKGGQTGVQNQATQTTIPPEVLQRYNQVYARGEQAADQPFQQYGGQFVAPVNATQQNAITNITNAQGEWQPAWGQGYGTLNQAGTAYQNAPGQAAPLQGMAAGLIPASLQASQPLTGQQIGQYMSPYVGNVVNATTNWLNQQNAMQRNALNSDAISQGAFGGDRSGIAQGVLAGQQNLANSQTIAGLYNQGYSQALGAAQQQQAQRVGALQQGSQLAAGLGGQLFGQGIQQGNALQGLGQSYANFGQQALGNTLQQAQAQLAAGTLPQQTEQANLSALYNQFLQQQAYPFQTTQFLSNLATGTGALSGSGSSTYAYQPQPFFSDDKLKENVHDIGKTKDGLRIVRYNFKDDPTLRIGFLASDVEQKMPEAVTKHHGVRAVDYERAARATGGGFMSYDDLKQKSEDNDNTWSQIGGLGSEPKDALEWLSPAVRIGRLVGMASGGLVPRESYAEGGYDPQAFAQMLQAHQAMYPGSMGRPGVTGNTGPRGMQLSQSHPQMLKAEQPRLAPPPESTMKSTMGGINDLAKTAGGLRDLYKTGKEAYDWATSPSDPLQKSGTQAAQNAVNQYGTVTYDPQQGAGVAAPAPADSKLSSLDTGDTSKVAGLVPDTASDATTSLADASDYGSLLDSSFFARRGGRAHRDSGGGLQGSIPYVDKDDQGYFPDDLDNPNDPAKLEAEQKGLAPPSSSSKSGSSGGSGMSDAAGIIGGLGSIAKLGMLFIKDGGRVDHDDIVRRARHAIGSIESSNRYDALGPMTGGDRAYGRYQVMGKNVGPWTREALGRELTPEQFLADREAQDRVFDHHFGKALAQHGTPEDAASVWFSGRPMRLAGNDRDVLGTSVPDYISKFSRHMGEDGGDEPARGLVPHEAVTGESQPNVNLTARTLNELGLNRGGRAGFEDGGSPVDRLLALGRPQHSMPLNYSPPASDPAPGVVPPPKADDLSGLGQTVVPEPEPAAPLDPATHPSTSSIDRSLAPAATPAPTAPPSPGVAPATPAAAAPPAAAPAPVDQTPAPGVVPKQDEAGFFDRHGWLDRNERPVMTALSFLGNMLSSPSRTFAGALGQGLVGAAQTWPGMGFKQQSLDIEQQQANTQQIGKVQDAINLTAAQRAEQLRLNPNASTAAHDAVLRGLVGKMGDLLKTPGMEKLPVGVNYQGYMKNLPAETQSVIGNLNTQDNPWLLDALAASVTDPRGKQEYIRLRDQAVERLRSGQARDKTGLQVVPAESLTRALLQFETQKQSAAVTGGQLSPGTRFDQAQQKYDAWVSSHPGYTTPGANPSLDAERKALLDEVAAARAALTANPMPGRRLGGRAPMQAGGVLPPDDTGGNGEGVAPVQVAQAEPEPDYNSPEYQRKRAAIYGEGGLKARNEQSLRNAQDIESTRQSTGTRLVPGPGGSSMTEQQPGAITTAQQQAAAKIMVEQNAKLNDELFERSQMGNQALQLAKELRSTMFDENGKPTSSMGPFNEIMNKAGAVFQQLGVPQHVLNDLKINPADKQASEKLQASIAAAIAHGDLGPNVRQSQFFHFMNAATPNMGMMPAAAQFIIDRVLIPRAQLEVDAYNSIKDLPPTENHRKVYRDWMLQNPWYTGARLPQEQAPSQRGAAPGTVPMPLRGIKGLEKNQDGSKFRDPATGTVYDREGNKVP